MSKINFITYSNGGDEVIICTPQTEKETIKLYFTEGGRDIEDYDREEIPDGAISTTVGVQVR